MFRAAAVLSALCLANLARTPAGQILGLQEGEACNSLGGGRGVCTLLGACRDPGDFRKEHPPICSFKGLEPVICCPKLLSTRLQPGLKASQFCRSVQHVCQGSLPPSPGGTGLVFGNAPAQPEVLPRQERSTEARREFARLSGSWNLTQVHEVYGGFPAKSKIHTSMDDAEIARILSGDDPIVFVYLPRRKREGEDEGEIRLTVFNGDLSEPRTRTYMALIGYGPSRKKEWGCGGSLISARYILSAAHCASPDLLGPAKWARLGDLDISTTTDDAKVQDLAIVERLIHPSYQEPKVYNDIALFRLDRDAAFTPWVSPVCLHTQREISQPVAIVTGWGRVDFAGETSKHLLEANLDVYNDTECRRLLPYKDNKTPRGIDTELMFCAGKSDGSKDACSGDSGGPLVVKVGDSCLKTQIGITSYGNMCGLPDSPGVYTRVSRYVPWIEGIVFNDV